MAANYRHNFSQMFEATIEVDLETAMVDDLVGEEEVDEEVDPLAPVDPTKKKPVGDIDGDEPDPDDLGGMGSESEEM